jgi:hypothetical protein
MKGEEIYGAPVSVVFAVYLPAYFDYEYALSNIHIIFSTSVHCR